MILVQLRVRDHFARIADVLSIYFAQRLRQVFLLGSLRAPRGQRPVHEIVEARQLPQSILPPEFIEPRHAVFAVADQVERRYVDLARRRMQPPHFQVLQETREISQRQQSQALPPHAQGQVGQSA